VADAGGIRAGKAFVEIGGNTSPLQKALNVGKSALKGFAVAGAAAFVAYKAGKALVEPVTGAINDFVASGDQLDKMSARTGMSVEALSELRYAAGQSGTSLEALETGVRKMQNTITDAADGSGAAAKALDGIGLSAQQLQSLTPEQQFETITKALNGIVDPTAKASAAMDIFGKSGTGLLPMIGGLDELRQKAQALGVTMSAEDATAAAALGDAFDDLSAAGGGLKNSFGAGVAEALTAVTEGIAGSLPALKDWANSAGQILGEGLTYAWNIMQTVGEAIATAWESIKAVTLPVLETIGAAVSVAFERISAVVGPIMQSVGESVSSAWQSVTAVTGPVLTWLQEAVVTAFAGVGFVISNFENIAAAALIGTAYEVVKFGNQVQYFFGEVCPKVIEWFGENWRDIFKTVADYVETVITNMAANIFSFFTAVYNWLSGDEWSFEWIALTEGFESSLKKLPEIAEREIGALEKELKGELEALTKELGIGWTEYRKSFQGDMEAVKQAGESAAEAREETEKSTGLSGEAARRKWQQLDEEAARAAEKAKTVEREAKSAESKESQTSVVGMFNPNALWGLAAKQFTAIGESLADQARETATAVGGDAGLSTRETRELFLLQEIANGIRKLVNAAQMGGLEFTGP